MCAYGLTNNRCAQSSALLTEVWDDYNLEALPDNWEKLTFIEMIRDTSR
jgi:hypothetical protein